MATGTADTTGGDFGATAAWSSAAGGGFPSNLYYYGIGGDPLPLEFDWAAEIPSGEGLKSVTFNFFLGTYYSVSLQMYASFNGSLVGTANNYSGGLAQVTPTNNTRSWSSSLSYTFAAPQAASALTNFFLMADVTAGAGSFPSGPFAYLNSASADWTSAPLAGGLRMML